MTKAGSHPSRIDFVTLDGPRLGGEIAACGCCFQPGVGRRGSVCRHGAHCVFSFGKLPLQPAAGNKVLKVTSSGGWFAGGQSCVRERRQMTFHL